MVVNTTVNLYVFRYYSQYYLSGNYQKCGDIICWRPTAVKDVEANTAVGVDIWMEHSETKAIRNHRTGDHLEEWTVSVLKGGCSGGHG